MVFVVNVLALLLIGLHGARVQGMVMASPATKCPETIPQLEQMLASEKWTPEDLRYNVTVSPDQFPENFTDDHPPVGIDTNTTITVSLRAKSADDPVILDCSIVLPSYRNERKGIYSNWEHPENVSTAGSLWYDGETYTQTLYHSLFPVGTENLTKYKARYTFSVAQSNTSNYTILLNMPLRKSEPNMEKPGWVWNHYQESPAMWSDQIVVMILGGSNLRKVEYTDTAKHRTFSLYWRPNDYQPQDEQEQVRVNECILEWNAGLLAHFESRFGVMYPLDKLDLVATTALGTRSAVESSEKYLGFGRSEKKVRFNAKNGTCSTPTLLDARAWVIGVLQQWMGFIKHSWYAGYSEDTLWGLLGYFLREGVTSVVGDTYEDEQLFTYTLGRRKRFSIAFDPSKPGLREGAVLQMLEDILTKPVFDDGVIKNFMGKLNDTEATLEVADLYGAMDRAVETHNKTHLFPEGITMKELIQSWMTTRGKPWVRVSLRNDDPRVVSFAQTAATPFNYDDHAPIPESQTTPKVERNGSWIPLEIVSDSESRFTWLSPNTSKTVQVQLMSDVREAGFFWINPNITAYFGVLYDQPLTILVTKELLENPNVVQWRLRAKLISEYFQFAKDNETDIGSALEMLSYLDKEDNPVVWNTILNGILLGSWQLDVKGLAEQKLHKYLGSLMDKALERIRQGSLNATEYNAESSNSSDRLTWAELTKGCISTKTPGCMEYSKQLLTFWQGHPDLGNPFERYGDSGDQAQCLALRGSVPGDKLYNFYVEMNKVTEDNATKDTSYCMALLCTGNETLLLDTFSKSLSNATKEKNECPSVNAVSIGTEYRQMINPVFKMLKQAVLNESANSEKLVNFLHSFYNQGLDDEVINELDKFYVEYGKKNQINWGKVTYFTEEFNAGRLQDAVQLAKAIHKEQQESRGKYSNRLLDWLENKGY